MRLTIKQESRFKLVCRVSNVLCFTTTQLEEINLTTSTIEHTEPSKRNWWHKKSVLIPLIVIAVIGLAIWGIAYFLFHNRAADIAAPLERSLVVAGAAKECDGGDPGRGPDNIESYYGVSYDVRMSKDDAISLMYRVAKDNGYNLTHASPSNRGHLSFDEPYLGQWYFDDSKQQPYGDIEAGQIKLDFIVDGPGERGCKTNDTIQPGHALITFNIRLPSFKH